MRDDDALFDAYLNAALDGEVEPIDSFCHRHGASDALHQRLSTLRRAMEDSASRPGGSGASAPAPRMVGDFRLLEPLGEGGMGQVFRAEQVSLGRSIALKLIRPDRASSPSARARFRREAEALARVQHPNLVTIHAVGESDGYLYLAMEEIRGTSLDRLIRAGNPISIPRVLDWFAQIARALDAVHTAGIVHRDVKPSNICITSDDRAILLDFGLAQLDDQASLTQTGVFTGTPFYASPEQVRGDGNWSAPTTDIYSAGAALYETVASDVPFSGDSSERLFHAILTGDPVRPGTLRRDVPRDLDTVILKAMAKEPAQRFASAAALASDLEAIREFRPIAARPESWPRRSVRFAKRHPAAAGAAIVAMLALIAFAIFLNAQRLGRNREQLASIDRHLETARDATADYVDAREKAAKSRASVERLNAAMVSRWLAPDERRTLRADRSRTDTETARGTERFFAAIESLREAERLGADRQRVDAVRAKLYVIRWREAHELGRDAQAAAFRALALRHDHTGRFGAELDPRGTVGFRTTPAGADVHLYRYRPASAVVSDGERRLVPIPFRGQGALRADAFSLEVLATTGELHAGDVITQIAGEPIAGALFASRSGRGVHRFDRLIAVNDEPVANYGELAQHVETDATNSLTLRRGGEEVDIELPAALRLARLFAEPDDLIADATEAIPVERFRDGGRAAAMCSPRTRVASTSTPLDRSELARVGTAPCAAERLAVGSYLALISAAGHEPQRVPLVIEAGATTEIDITLHADGTCPPGFVHVPAGTFRTGGAPNAAWSPLPSKQVDVPEFWMQQFEVTRGDYADFLNDPATQRAIANTESPRFYPRNTVTLYRGGTWAQYRQPDGTYQVPDHLHTFSVNGVSWNDAVAYAAWKTARAKADGLPHRYRLPTELEWEKAARGVDGRRYVFGNDFMPAWVDGRFSKPGQLAFSRPGRHSVDVSVYGVYDLSGGVFEWCADQPDGSIRICRGGAIAGVLPESFQVTARFVVSAESTESANGFRLVAELDENARTR